MVGMMMVVSFQPLPPLPLPRRDWHEAYAVSVCMCKRIETTSLAVPLTSVRASHLFFCHLFSFPHPSLTVHSFSCMAASWSCSATSTSNTTTLPRASSLNHCHCHSCHSLFLSPFLTLSSTLIITAIGGNCSNDAITSNNTPARGDCFCCLGGC